MPVHVPDILGRVLATKWNATIAGVVARSRDAISPHDGVRHVRSFQIKGFVWAARKFVLVSASQIVGRLEPYALGNLPCGAVFETGTAARLRRCGMEGLNLSRVRV